MGGGYSTVTANECTSSSSLCEFLRSYPCTSRVVRTRRHSAIGGKAFNSKEKEAAWSKLEGFLRTYYGIILLLCKCIEWRCGGGDAEGQTGG